MTEDIDWTTLELELTEDPAVLEMLDEFNRRIVERTGFDPLTQAMAIEQFREACQQIVKAFATAIEPVIDALASLLKPLVIDFAVLAEELDRVLASRRPARPSHTLNRRAPLAPTRDLRATEAPRRPPTTYRRR